MGVVAKASAVLITMVGFFAGRPSFDVKYASGRGARSVEAERKGHHAAMPHADVRAFMRELRHDDAATISDLAFHS
jgi:hypothetical protein